MKRLRFISATGAVASSLVAASGPARGAVANDAPDALRADVVYHRRVDAAAADRAAFRPSVGNGDDERYARSGYIASFTKMLPHNADGSVVVAAYEAYRRALRTRQFDALATYPIAPRFLSLTARAFDENAYPVGCDSRGIFVPPAPRLDSPQTAREMIELYWFALTRDVPFADYGTDPTIARACADLALTPATIFRGPGAGAGVGPHLSQFVWRDVPVELFGAVPQRHDLPVAGRDFLTAHATWLAAQNGTSAPEPLTRSGSLRYLATGRDLADFLTRSSNGGLWRRTASIVDALDPQARTGAFDLDDICAYMALAQNIAGSAVLYQKFGVQRRLRPEELGGLLERDRSGAPIDESLRRAAVLDLVRGRTATLLLPQAYPRGCPPHSAYPAGHATSAGAAATILKAFVDPAFVLPQPVVASSDGMQLVPHAGPPLTLGNEIDKLAANYAYGRGAAGVHYRSDSDAGLLLGEAAAIGVLQDLATLAGAGFRGFRFAALDGRTVDIH